MDSTLPMLLFSGPMNTGQACVGQTRILAPRSRYDEIVEKIGNAVAAPVGMPDDPAAAVGPLISEKQRDRVEGYIKKGVEEGARIVTGGGRPEGLDSGWFVQPTVFADVDNSMTIAQEEIFGPVLVVIPYEDEDAVRIANDSVYGLAGSVYTTDNAKALEIASKIRTGTYGVNMYAFDPGAPFGGYKNSGVGRGAGRRASPDTPSPRALLPFRLHPGDLTTSRGARHTPYTAIYLAGIDSLPSRYKCLVIRKSNLGEQHGHHEQGRDRRRSPQRDRHRPQGHPGQHGTRRGWPKPIVAAAVERSGLDPTEFGGPDPGREPAGAAATAPATSPSTSASREHPGRRGQPAVRVQPGRHRVRRRTDRVRHEPAHPGRRRGVAVEHAAVPQAQTVHQR